MSLEQYVFRLSNLGNREAVPCQRKGDMIAVAQNQNGPRPFWIFVVGNDRASRHLPY